MLAAATCERYGVAVNCYCVGEERIMLLVLNHVFLKKDLVHFFLKLNEFGTF